MPEIDSACIKIERGYQDMITRKQITAKSPFIEKLTHDSYIVQTKRIKSDRYQIWGQKHKVQKQNYNNKKNNTIGNSHSKRIIQTL
ncbi:MAG: hypothetical protein LBT83_03090 [Tannerella sp.]|nr:hypothetical protein [Tannerella sp.]